MSQLRAPAARADRREGGRHGRPAARPASTLPETPVRPQLLRLAVLPPIAVVLAASAAVLFTVRSTGTRPGLTFWGVLAGAVSVALAAVLIAAVAADRAAKSVNDRIGALRRTTARGEAELRALVEALRRGDGPPQRTPRGGPPDGADDFDLLAADLARAHDGAVTAVVQATQLSSQAGSEQKLEVFLNLARRLQSLVHREISILDELENEIEDPDLLKGLFHVDHLATRIRRHAENLAVLGGAVSRRQWSHPVPMTEVLRSAIAEVEQYSRVKLVPPIDGTLRGHAVADVIHLLAELVENATVFSAPHTQVLLRANLVTSGLAVEVEDRGLGMPVTEQNKMNALLTDPDQVNVGSLLADGRIGLFVVSQLARRHGINVRLQTNIYGGVQAVLVVPQGLLGAEPGAPGVVPGASDGTGIAGPGGGGAGVGPVPAGAPRSARGTAADVRPSIPVPGAPGTSVPPGPYPQGAAGPGALGDTGPQRVVPGEGPVVRSARQPDAPRGSGPAANGSEPAVPLPVRGSRQERPNPAEAVPGIRPDDRRLVEQSAAMPPTPRTGTVRGTMGKPQLPRRRAQEHIAPQLRDGPAAPRPDAEYLAGHDPGLMAAFQRGIGLAEAQQHMEAETTGDPDLSAYAMGAPHMGTAHMDAPHTDTPPHTGARHMDTDPITGTDRSRLSLTDPGLTDTGPTDTGLPPTGPSHLNPGRTSPAHARPDHTPTRHDGSASAG
ncbi:ATP-binding protein [Streptomyces aquilus]|uniref:sensor histidine kinase n=1 Tax=Streptomyces aquilus TaxID=2548456 RepID=UPI0036AA5BB2